LFKPWTAAVNETIQYLYILENPE